MNFQQFLDEIEGIIDDLCGVDVPVIGTRYISLFFSKFKTAYDSGLFKEAFAREMILDELIGKWCAEDPSTLNKKKNLLEDLVNMAYEWDYALKHYFV